YDSMDCAAPETVADVLQDLDDSRLQLYFQRIERTTPHEAGSRSLEVLVRMLDSTGRPLPAADFIQEAERYGIIERIDRWVLDQVLDTFRRREFSDETDTVWINVSGTSINSVAFHDYVLEAIACNPLPRCRLGFEIPEQAFIDAVDTVEYFVTSMYNAGLLIAIDNFGSNLAALERIASLPIDCLKLHPDLTARVAGDHVLQDLVNACVRIADSIGMKTAAGHIEDERTAAWVRSTGVDFAQGYALGRPATLAELVKHEQPA
ncbi:MAG: EAL domain-containing protein, partial [Gammaproteobacteria bacterium]|nr:EAL domain-containing protein [Gammaproteobacteria bacterium]